MITNENVTNYYYINNVFADFYKATLDYISDGFGPRFTNIVMGTYDKAVQQISNKDNNGNRELDKEQLPLIVLNPSGEFTLSETGGHQSYRFPNIAPGFINRWYSPIYQDENVMITPGYSRIKGEIEVIFLLNSFYEFCDVRMLLLHGFNGLNRITYPFLFNSFIIIPEALYSFNYTNDVSGDDYILDWETAGATERLIKSINSEEIIYPVNMKPMFKMTGMSDGSKKYGGTDELAEWRLVCTFEYEIEIPSYLYFVSNYLAKSLEVNIKLGSAYSYYSTNSAPVNVLRFERTWEYDDVTLETPELTSDVTTDLPDLIFKVRYYHVITETDLLDENYVTINSPEEITDQKLIKVFSNEGEYIYDYHYKIKGDQIILQREYVTSLEEDQIIDIFVYREES